MVFESANGQLNMFPEKKPAFYVDHIHLVTDGTIEQLHQFAQVIRVKPCWFHNPKGKNKPHYDLKPHQVDAAIASGAIKVSSKKIVRILQRDLSQQ